MSATMLLKFSSFLKRFAYTAGLVFITFILTIGIASTFQWLYFDSGTIINFLNTFQCNPYSDTTTACTLGHGSRQLRAIASDMLLDQVPALMLTPWKIKLLYQTHYLVPAPDTERYVMVRKWALGWTGNDSVTLDIIAPATWIPATSKALIWVGSFILSAAFVGVLYYILRKQRADVGAGGRQLVRASIEVDGEQTPAPGSLRADQRRGLMFL